MALLDTLPDSGKEGAALGFVAILAGLACVSRILYGKDDLKWRTTIGSTLVAMVVGMMVYSTLVNTTGLVGGYLTVAIGIGTGLFTDDFMKRAKDYMFKSEDKKRVK